jgi:DNA-binding beta-propeller fold protein YncE
MQRSITSSIFVALAAMLLNACTAAQLTSIAPQTAAVHARSWMLPESSSETLLYYTDDEGITALSYPKGQVVGSIAGLDQPQGVCSDSKGDIFVTTRYTEAVYEFAHGGTEPIAKLGDYGYYPMGCAVDPVTGNLAVANTEAMNGNAGNVAIYTGASGKPTFYSTSEVYNYSWPAYDSSGNLFVKGSTLAELPYDSSTMFGISLPVYGEGIQWDGQYLAMIDGPDKKVYRIAIFGSSGTVVSTISFSGLFTEIGYDFVLPAGAIVMPYGSDNPKSQRIGEFPYPKGGTVKKNIHKAYQVQSLALSI